MHAMKIFPWTLTLLFIMSCSFSLQAQQRDSKPLFDMRAMLDESTLKIDVLQDWHQVNGPVPTRQKLISIEVGQLVPGRPYRVPVRMIVPANINHLGYQLDPMAIGRASSTKVNANMGASPVSSGTDEVAIRTRH